MAYALSSVEETINDETLDNDTSIQQLSVFFLHESRIHVNAAVYLGVQHAKRGLHASLFFSFLFSAYIFARVLHTPPTPMNQ